MPRVRATSPISSTACNGPITIKTEADSDSQYEPGILTDSPPLRTAIKKLFKDHGTIMVASAGNSCSDSGGQEEAGGDEDQRAACDAPQTTTVKYPAAYPEVLAVTATDDNDQITLIASRGQRWMSPPQGVMRKDQTYSFHVSIWRLVWVWKRHQSSGCTCHWGPCPEAAATTGSFLGRCAVSAAADRYAP